MKKFVSIMVSLLLVLQLSQTTYATSQIPNIELSEGMELLSVEIIPNEEMESLVPEYISEALSSTDQTMTYGVSRPNKNNVWDLSQKPYPFHAKSTYEDVFSNYVFKGHNGSIKLIIDEKSGNKGVAGLNILVRNFWNTVIYSTTFDRGSYSLITVNNINPEDLIYFAIMPGDCYTYVTRESYLAKN